MRTLFTVASLLFSLLLSACSSIDKDKYYEDSYKEVYSNKADYNVDAFKNITNQEMNGIFTKDYGLDSLSGHDLFWSETEKTIIIRFYFPKDTQRWQINSARAYSLNELNLMDVNVYEYNPYGLWVINNLIEVDPRIISEIYADGDLIIQDMYTNKVDVNRYENTVPEIDARILDTEWSIVLDEYINKKLSPQRIAYQKSLLGYSVIIQIHSKSTIIPRKVESLMKHIVENVADQAVRDNLVDKRNNGLFELIVLELYTPQGKYYEKVYVNIIDKFEWQSMDWMNPTL
jgi:hypothetical protein